MNQNKKHIGSNGFKKSLIVISILGILSIFWAVTLSPAAKQRKNLSIAEKFNTDHLSPLIMNHSKFGDLQTGIYTGKGGCLAVNGWVKTEKDLEELKSLVNTINPPLSVHWTIKIEDILLKDLIENEDK